MGNSGLLLFDTLMINDVIAFHRVAVVNFIKVSKS